MGIPDTDVDGFLRVRKEMIIISAIEETHRRTQQAAAEAYQRKMQADWKKQRAEILEELAGYSKVDNNDSRSSGLGRSTLGAVSTSQARDNRKSFKVLSSRSIDLRSETALTVTHLAIQEDSASIRSRLKEE